MSIGYHLGQLNVAHNTFRHGGKLIISIWKALYSLHRCCSDRTALLLSTVRPQCELLRQKAAANRTIAYRYRKTLRISGFACHPPRTSQMLRFPSIAVVGCSQQSLFSHCLDSCIQPQRAGTFKLHSLTVKQDNHNGYH